MARWARFFKISRSGYYAYMKLRDKRKQEKKAVQEIIRKIFTDSEDEYGPDRICGIMRRSGHKASYRKISRYMAEMNLQSIHNKHKTRSLTDSRNARDDDKYRNLVRGNEYDQPKQVICSDITYLKSGEGWLYLCVIKDIVTGEILGESTSSRMKTDLVIQAFLNALTRHNLSPGIIYHSDRGSQYTAKRFRELLQKHGIIQSFSRIGIPGDNS